MEQIFRGIFAFLPEMRNFRKNFHFGPELPSVLGQRHENLYRVRFASVRAS